MGIDNRKSVENTEDFFDDDFEVIYQEEDYSNFLRRKLSQSDDEHGNDRYDHEKYDYDNEYDYEYTDDYEYADDYNDSYDHDDYGRDYDDNYGYEHDHNYGSDHDRYDYDDDYYYDDYDDGYRRHRSRHKVPDLITPAARTAQTGGKFIFRLISLLLRSATLILIAVITYTLAINFWENHRTYGDILHAVLERNYILAAYAAVAAFLLLFELFSFLLVLATSKRTDRRGRRVDTGRGLFSFICIYAGSYFAFFLNGLVPLSPSPLLGIQGALKVYGSLRSVLLPLCIAGIISCLVRKFAIR